MPSPLAALPDGRTKTQTSFWMTVACSRCAAKGHSCWLVCMESRPVVLPCSSHRAPLLPSHPCLVFPCCLLGSAEFASLDLSVQSSLWFGEFPGWDSI